MRPSSQDSQSGTAILMALLIVAITMALSTFWFLQTRISIRKTQQMLISDQMFLTTDAVTSWAIHTLQVEKTFPVSYPSNTVKIENGSLAGRIDNYTNDVLRNGIIPKKMAMVSPQSGYFLLKTVLLQGRERLILYTLFHRTILNGKYVVVILWQSRGLT